MSHGIVKSACCSGLRACLSAHTMYSSLLACCMQPQAAAKAVGMSSRQQETVPSCSEEDARHGPEGSRYSTSASTRVGGNTRRAMSPCRPNSSYVNNSSSTTLDESVIRSISQGRMAQGLRNSVQAPLHCSRCNTRAICALSGMRHAWLHTSGHVHGDEAPAAPAA